MSVEDTQRFFNQLMNGLRHLHALGICHRDIKPENLLLTHDGKFFYIFYCFLDNLKISDFGFATLYRNKFKERFLDTKCGSLPYIAPDVLTGRYQ